MEPHTASEPQPPQRISIKNYFLRTIGAFGKLLKALENSEGTVLEQLPRETLEDQIGYLRLWAGTNGAHRTGRASLDHKLRLASHIRDKVTEDLRGLEQAVNEVRELVLKNEGCRPPSPFSDSSASSFSDEDLPTTTPLQYRFQEVQQRIKGLMRLSAALRQPASRDLTARYSEFPLGHYEKWDLDHVRDKLADIVRDTHSSEVDTEGNNPFQVDPWSLSNNVTDDNPPRDCDDHSHQPSDLDIEEQPEAHPDPLRVYYQPPEYLVLRLAKANNERRQLLQYLKRHYERISAGIESIPINTDSSKVEINPQLHFNDAFQDFDRRTAASSRKTGTTNPTLHETNSLTGYISALSNAPSEDGATDTSFATSKGFDIGTGQKSSPRARLEIPLPPITAEPLWEREFLCPLCWCHTNPTTLSAWRRHVMRDIKPYICTFEHCPAGSHLFDSRRAWYGHEQQYHRREWWCRQCRTVHGSSEAFKLHLREAHPEQPPYSDSNITLCERVSASDQQCSICGITYPSRYLPRHMGRHMEQLALFTVHSWWEAIEEEEEEEEESDEEQEENEDNDKALDEENSDPLTSMANLALTYWNQGRWKEAEELDVQVLEMRKRALGEEHPDTLSSMANLEATFGKQGRWKEAEELNMQVLEMRKRVLGEEHPDTLISMASLASTFREQGRWKEAEELDIQVLEMRKRVLGEEHPDTLISMANLASTYWNLGRWKEAEGLDAQVLDMRKRVLGEEHPDTLSSMGNLATTFRNQGLWKEAEELEAQVLKTTRKGLGAEHPDTLISMANLAVTFRKQGRWKEAEELNVQVLEMRKRVLGEEHPDTLSSMGNLAATFRKQGRWKEAEELEVQALEVTRRVVGEEHPDTLDSMASLALTYWDLGRWKEAEELNMQVLEMRKGVLGEEHPYTLTAMSNLASTFRNQGRWKEAEELEVQVLEATRRAVGEEHPDTLNSMGCLAHTVADQQRLSEALELYRRVLDGHERIFGNDHPNTLATVHNMALVFDKQGEYDKALEWYRRALHGREKAIGKDHPDTVTTANLIASLLHTRDSTGQS